jgi:hypothetical protein
MFLLWKPQLEVFLSPWFLAYPLQLVVSCNVYYSSCYSSLLGDLKKKLKTTKSIGEVVIKNRHLMGWGACLRTTFSYYSPPRFFAWWFTQKGRIPNGTVSDAPCGDMTWMSLFLRGRKDVDYTGPVYKFNAFFNFFYLNYLLFIRTQSIFHGKFVFSGYDIIPMNIENAKSNFSSGTLYSVQFLCTFQH